ncbi:MAG TPA: ATP-binding cassette domain-containing protein [Candidatus Desulfofervidus auxilii]|uniref:ATP-binding cassette domain-containing protein n=1 Tax=Desulfofervidus auxilii TaxID=1621989 RepID=A0A7C0U4I2_DESA2|nr:ATP-binding cassette domain-containing protein [Candidatus Desulfofervidus auxilii]
MIEVINVSKWFGERQALKNISFKVEKGEILGFLGPNGAGKTTTMRILTGFFPPSSGTVKIAGEDITKNPIFAKQKLGYLPENNPLYDEMTVEAYLKFVASVKGIKGKKQKMQVEKVIEECGIKEVKNRLIKRLSKGYRQRVGLAQALVNDPEILILDEPTIGLDPKQIYEIRQLIKNLAGEKTVILSTHILPEVSMVCTRVVIINKGEVVAEDTPDNLTAKRGQIEILVKAPAEEIENHFKSIPEIEGIEVKKENEFTRAFLRFSPQIEIRPFIVKTIVEKGWDLLELIPRRASLEEVFVQLVTEEAS